MTDHPDGDWSVTYSYAASDEAPSEAVVRAVAAATNRGVLSLEPLHRTVATDALDSLFTADSQGVVVAFTYADCLVEVEPGTVVVCSECTE